MRFSNTLAICLTALSTVPSVTVSETFKESFECEFGRDLVGRPTLERIVFSVGEFGHSALLHEAETPKIDTNVGSGRIKRDIPVLPSIAWVGQNYTYSAIGRTYATNEAKYDAIDLRDMEYS